MSQEQAPEHAVLAAAAATTTRCRTRREENHRGHVPEMVNNGSPEPIFPTFFHTSLIIIQVATIKSPDISELVDFLLRTAISMLSELSYVYLKKAVQPTFWASGGMSIKR